MDAPDFGQLIRGTENQGAGRNVSRRLGRLDAAELAGLNQVNEDVPLGLLENGRVGVFTDADLVAFDDNFRAGRAGRAERDSEPFHVISPPFPSMWGHTAAGRPLSAAHDVLDSEAAVTPHRHLLRLLRRECAILEGEPVAMPAAVNRIACLHLVG